ncbi:hypothetical protein QFC21_006607 [Naganishia friedmannii]|uniref:Uncharacterized protein n=1 Tax=Naganishia friedmannii TaxID=89922 RepID=A0ACC2V1U1_9TREE|nr:hypothetical protein QFC21_006607 [Naganishia friedmannii]
MESEKHQPVAYVTDASSRYDPEQDAEVDAVFGKHTEGEVDYKSVGWIKATVIMLKTIIALGVLAMPTVLSATGGVPGSLSQFKRNHPETYSMDTVGYVLAGRFGQELFSVAYPMFMIFLAGSGFVAISIAFNAVSTHATCTVVWVIIAAVGTFALASIQTLNKVGIVSWVGFVSVMAAIMIITIAVGIQDRPVTAPQVGPWDKNISAFNGAGTFLGGMGAVSTVVFSYSGTPAFFNVIGEMRNPKFYNRSLYICQAVVTATYLTIGIVVYYFCGQYLANPALGSAGGTIKKIAYGVALPVWLGIVASCVTMSFILAEGEIRFDRNTFENQFTHHIVTLSMP